MPSRWTNPRTRGTLLLVVGATLVGCSGCTSSTTAVSRELAARPRVEQLALATAMDDAYGRVDFGFANGKKVFVETKSLAKTDVEFITAFVQKKVMEGGGTPVPSEAQADLRVTSTLEVSGTDEVEKMGKDVVMGQFKGTLQVVDLAEGAIVQMHALDSLAQTKRNRKGTTKILEN